MSTATTRASHSTSSGHTRTEMPACTPLCRQLLSTGCTLHCAGEQEVSGDVVTLLTRPPQPMRTVYLVCVWGGGAGYRSACGRGSIVSPVLPLTYTAVCVSHRKDTPAKLQIKRHAPHRTAATQRQPTTIMRPDIPHPSPSSPLTPVCSTAGVLHVLREESSVHCSSTLRQ